MKKGFTLIELLAVIVILAIIALIATPIILGIIADARNEAKVRSAELYLTAVEQAIIRKKMSDTTFNPSSCEIVNGVVTCGGKVLQVDVDGTLSSEGNITLNNGKVSNAVLELENEYIVYENSEVVTVNIPSSKEETPASCFEYEGDSELTITAYKCGKDSENYISDLVIPEMIDGKPVTTINDPVFWKMGLTSVVFPDTMDTIEDEAFGDGNELKSIIIPSGVRKIDYFAFAYTGLSNVIIKEGVEYIGDGSFMHNELKSIIIPNSVTGIGIEAFCHNNITSIVIPSSVTYIEDSAFANNPLTSVTIQNTKENVGIYEGAFGDFDVNKIKWEPVE